MSWRLRRHPRQQRLSLIVCLWWLGDKTLLLKIFCGLAKGYRQSNLSLQLPWTLTCQLAFTVLEGAVGAAGRENTSMFSPSTMMQHRLPRQVVSTGAVVAGWLRRKHLIADLIWGSSTRALMLTLQTWSKAVSGEIIDPMIVLFYWMVLWSKCILSICATLKPWSEKYCFAVGGS